MVEVNRALYMNEMTGEKLIRFGEIQVIIGKIADSCRNKMRRISNTYEI
jgi:hypothetical protein